MRNMLAFLAALTLTFVGIGWYLDWFALRHTPSPSGQRSVTIDINTRKIYEDALKAEQKIQQRLAEKSRAADTPAGPDKSAAPRAPQDLSIPGLNFEGNNPDGAFPNDAVGVGNPFPGSR
jgi:hypothetical protein